MPAIINKNGVWAAFKYGPEHQRTVQDRSDRSFVIYAGAQEVEVKSDGTTVKTYWPDGIGVEIDRGAKVTELNWTHLDRLGSPIAITTETGMIREKLEFDVWGKRRDTDNHISAGGKGIVDNRGFTGHEMLDQLDLVHLNGRIYNPHVGKFLSADPLVSEPINGQSYNRYSYVLNNPTNLIDPTGFEQERASTTLAGGGDWQKVGAQGYDDGKQFFPGNAEPRSVQHNASARGAGHNDSALSDYVGAKATQATGKINGCDAGMQCVVIIGQKLELTKDQRAFLDKGNFISFWHSRYLVSHDSVAKTALSGWAPQLLNKTTAWQKTSSTLSWMVLRLNLSGTDAEKDATMQKIGLDLARAHADAVGIDMRDRVGVPGLLSPNQVAGYHWDVFSKYGVSSGAFGGTFGGLPASSYPVTWCEGCDGNKK
jgi:RHS repeat-associated protein